MPNLIIVLDWFTMKYIVMNEDGNVVAHFHTKKAAMKYYPEAEVLCVTFL